MFIMKEVLLRTCLRELLSYDSTVLTDQSLNCYMKCSNFWMRSFNQPRKSDDCAPVSSASGKVPRQILYAWNELRHQLINGRESTPKCKIKEFLRVQSRKPTNLEKRFCKGRTRGTKRAAVMDENVLFRMTRKTIDG